MRSSELLLRLLLAVALLGNGLMLPVPTAQASVPEQGEAGDCHGSAPEPRAPHASTDPGAHSMPCCDDAVDPGSGCACDCLQSSAMGVASFEFVGSHAPFAEIARRLLADMDDGPAASLLRPPIHRA